MLQEIVIYKKEKSSIIKDDHMFLQIQKSNLIMLFGVQLNEKEILVWENGIKQINTAQNTNYYIKDKYTIKYGLEQEKIDFYNFIKLLQQLEV